MLAEGCAGIPSYFKTVKLILMAGYKHLYHSTWVNFAYYPGGKWEEKQRGQFNKMPVIVQFNGYSGGFVVAVWRLKFKPGKQMH